MSRPLASRHNKAITSIQQYYHRRHHPLPQLMVLASTPDPVDSTSFAHDKLWLGVKSFALLHTLCSIAARSRGLYLALHADESVRHILTYAAQSRWCP